MSRVSPWSVLALCVVGMVLWTQRLGHLDYLAHFAVGDASVYAAVAHNIAHGHGSSYDGLQLTNGYHPLWMLMQVPAYLGADTPLDGMGLARLLWGLIGLAAGLVWGRLVALSTGEGRMGWWMGALVAASGWSLHFMYAGLETGLVILLLGLTLLSARPLLEEGAARTKDALLFSGFVGLTELARLDAAFLLLPLCAWVAWTQRRRPALVLAAALPAIALVAPYLLWNMSTFGHITPVSGIAKTATTFSHTSVMRMTMPGGTFQPMALLKLGLQLVMLLSVAGLAYAASLRGILARRSPLLVLGPAAVAHWLYYALAMMELNTPWHVYPQVLLLFLAASVAGILILDRLRLSHPWVVALSAVVLLIGSEAVLYKKKSQRRPEVYGAYELGTAAHALPEGSRILMFDSWYTALQAPEHHWIDISGLAGDADMAERAQRRDMLGMVERFDVDYVVVRFPKGVVPAADRFTYVGEPKGTLGMTMALLPAGEFQDAWSSLSEADVKGAWLPALAKSLAETPAQGAQAP